MLFPVPFKPGVLCHPLPRFRRWGHVQPARVKGKGAIAFACYTPGALHPARRQHGWGQIMRSNISQRNVAEIVRLVLEHAAHCGTPFGSSAERITKNRRDEIAKAFDRKSRSHAVALLIGAKNVLVQHAS